MHDAIQKISLFYISCIQNRILRLCIIILIVLQFCMKMIVGIKMLDMECLMTIKWNFKIEKLNTRRCCVSFLDCEYM